MLLHFSTKILTCKNIPNYSGYDTIQDTRNWRRHSRIDNQGFDNSMLLENFNG